MSRTRGLRRATDRRGRVEDADRTAPPGAGTEAMKAPMSAKSGGETSGGRPAHHMSPGTPRPARRSSVTLAMWPGLSSTAMLPSRLSPPPASRVVARGANPAPRPSPRRCRPWPRARAITALRPLGGCRPRAPLAAASGGRGGWVAVRKGDEDRAHTLARAAPRGSTRGRGRRCRGLITANCPRRRDRWCSRERSSATGRRPSAAANPGPAHKPLSLPPRARRVIWCHGFGWLQHMLPRGLYDRGRADPNPSIRHLGDVVSGQIAATLFCRDVARRDGALVLRPRALVRDRSRRAARPSDAGGAPRFADSSLCPRGWPRSAAVLRLTGLEAVAHDSARRCGR